MRRARGKTPRITLYGTRGCAHCRRLREWLQARDLAFRELDVERDRRAAREFQRLGARGVPVLLVGDRRIDGFDPRRLKQLLG